MVDPEAESVKEKEHGLLLLFHFEKEETIMFKKTVETIVGGALGLLTLYAVGRVCFQAGQDYAAMRYETYPEIKQLESKSIKASLKEEEDKTEAALIPADNPVPVPVQRKKKSALSVLFGAGRILGNRKSVIGNLVKSPEDHRFEAFVEGDELQIHVRRKEDHS